MKGLNMYNNCKKNSDCPQGHFCDHLDDKVCKSLLPSGRLCQNREMCLCGVCDEVSYSTRPNKPPIVYSVCGSC